MEWQTDIGLEIHIQLATKSKIFSGASTQYGAEPNAQACIIDLALPGVLPVLNRETVKMAAKFGLAVDAQVNQKSVFSRKNYFYPDLPKGYQISQDDQPIIGKGSIEVHWQDKNGNDQSKEIGITRAHLEEDAGKSMHDILPGKTGIDLNRASTPLLEIVSEPDMKNAQEAVAYLKTMHSLVRYLEICDGNMQEGSFRCDANVSVRPIGQETLGTRAELKNINSFKFVEKAINIEIERQIDVIENGGEVVQETRLYDSVKDETRSMRSKEEAHDYRYFPEPDLLPAIISAEEIEEIRSHMPELPWVKCQRLQDEHKLSAYDARLLTADKAMADYFDALLASDANVPAKIAANWLAGDILAKLNEDHLSIKQCPIGPKRLGGLLIRISDNTISNNIAKKVFLHMWSSEQDADSIIDEQGLKQITDEGELQKLIQTIIDENPNQVEQYRGGKDKLFGFFVGKAMKATQGKANPATINKLLKAALA
jgi:aspartyl-tRNA(Asn)/glutamyl-tRNA(Gln) amidotransferase subunit B